MAVLSELTELLRRWDVWKRVEEAPQRIEALEKRVAALELLLQRAPGEACPSCGALENRVIESRPAVSHGGRDHVYRCGDCGFEDVKMVT